MCWGSGIVGPHRGARTALVVGGAGERALRALLRTVSARSGVLSGGYASSRACREGSPRAAWNGAVMPGPGFASRFARAALVRSRPMSLELDPVGAKHSEAGLPESEP